MWLASLLFFDLYILASKLSQQQKSHTFFALKRQMMCEIFLFILIFILNMV